MREEHTNVFNRICGRLYFLYNSDELLAAPGLSDAVAEGTAETAAE